MLMMISRVVMVIRRIIMMQMQTEIDDNEQLLMMTRAWTVVVKQGHGWSLVRFPNPLATDIHGSWGT